MKKREGGAAVASVSNRSAVLTMDDDETGEPAIGEGDPERDEDETVDPAIEDRDLESDADDAEDGDAAVSALRGEAPASDESSLESSEAEVAAIQAGNELSDDELLSAVTALVYASPEPLSERRLVSLLDGPKTERVQHALETLKSRLAASGLPLELVAIAGGWQILTAPALADTVQRLFKARKSERVSPAALETLAVVAYRQPVTKAEIEAIRGVQAGPILRMLVDRGLVRVTGRADVPGHPLQYGTTRTFLERFGLGSIDDLPRDSELAKG